jgi:hypothetical protein
MMAASTCTQRTSAPSHSLSSGGISGIIPS